MTCLRMFSKLKRKKTSKEVIDTKLRVLFNNKMSGIWNEECENELCTIKAGKNYKGTENDHKTN